VEEITLEMLLQIVNGIGTVGLLVILFVLFYRGDIMSRRVYEELTKRILSELCERIIDEVHDLFEQERKARAGSE
jgi:hypothetical protein